MTEEEMKLVAEAYGWLWHVTTSDERVQTARVLLGNVIPKEMKKYGIKTAKGAGARVNVTEIERALLMGGENETI